MSVTNHVSATLEASDQQAALSALTEVRNRLPFLAGLSADERVALAKMGGKSLSFVEQSLQAAEAHPQALPPSFDVAEFRRDLQLWRNLQPIALQVTQLNELLNDTLMALGSDLYTEGLATYAYLKAAGNAEGLDSLKGQLSRRFSRRSSAAAPVPASA